MSVILLFLDSTVHKGINKMIFASPWSEIIIFYIFIHYLKKDVHHTNINIHTA